MASARGVFPLLSVGNRKIALFDQAIPTAPRKGRGMRPDARDASQKRSEDFTRSSVTLGTLCRGQGLLSREEQVVDCAPLALPDGVLRPLSFSANERDAMGVRPAREIAAPRSAAKPHPEYPSSHLSVSPPRPGLRESRSAAAAWCCSRPNPHWPPFSRGNRLGKAGDVLFFWRPHWAFQGDHNRFREFWLTILPLSGKLDAREIT